MGVLGASAILAIFAKRIKSFYGVIEMQFLTNFNERNLQAQELNPILTPWDTHITTFELNAQSPFIGKSLIESRIREEFGVNIAVIERGDYVINVPNRHEILYPFDTLSVIGTDEQLKNFEEYLELKSTETKLLDTARKVSLHHFTISKSSPLVTKNIRESRIRERSKGLVVGIERSGERIINPESDLVFQENDKVWIVGNEMRILVLIKELAV